MANGNIIESIHRFLLDDMEGDEKRKFEKEMSSNEAIKKQITMEQRFLKGIEYVVDAELKTTISSVHQGLKSQGFFKEQQSTGAKIININSRNKSRMMMAIAASLVIMLAAWFVFDKISSPDVNVDAIVADYYQPEKSITNGIYSELGNSFSNSPVTRNDRLYLALDQYQNGDYAAALTYLNGLHKEFPEDKTVSFYLGLSNIGLGNTKETIKLLTPLSMENFEFQDAAKWYLSLSLIMNKEIKEAEQVLNELTKNTSYAEMAKNLLVDLNK